MNETIPPPFHDQPVRYEERIVAYFDVLGWRDIIERVGADPARLGQLRSLVGLYGYFQQQLGSCPKGSALTAFSDNVIVSQRYEAGGVQDFIDTIGRYQFAAASSGFFIRGAVTVGQLFHDETSVFGPALVRAHYLESKHARYPRIILDPDRMDVLGTSKRIRTLEGHSTIDIFGPEFVRKCATPIATVATSSSATPRNSSGMVVVPSAPLKIILATVKAGLAETADEAARTKLLWLKEKVEDGIASMN